MPLFEHVAHLPYPREQVFAWHERPGAFVRLTPPGMAVLREGPTDGIRDGSRVRLRVSHPVLTGGATLLGLPFRPGVAWSLRHFGYVRGERFVDEQLTGPFHRWRHEHLFADAPGGGTALTDRVSWELPAAVPGAGRLVTGMLTRLFRFRESQLAGDLALHARLGANPAHVLIAGASGLIGTQLSALLTTGGHRVTRLVRRSVGAGEISWDPAGRRLADDALEGVDVVVNLSGRSIGGRFTRQAKEEIRSSRVDATATLVDALLVAGGRRSLVQASAVGYYGARRPGELLTEDSAPGEGFLADVVQRWEQAAAPAADAGVRTAFLRLGIVLSQAGGALLPQVPLFFVGAGGPLTTPEASASWVTLDDATRAFCHACFEPACAGPLNTVSPEPATAQEMAAAVGRAMGRPAALPTPAFAPRAVLGGDGYDQIIHTDQRVSGRRLSGTGFVFAQPSLAEALNHVLMR